MFYDKYKHPVETTGDITYDEYAHFEKSNDYILYNQSNWNGTDDESGRT